MGTLLLLCNGARARELFAKQVRGENNNDGQDAACLFVERCLAHLWPHIHRCGRATLQRAPPLQRADPVPAAAAAAAAAARRQGDCAGSKLPARQACPAVSPLLEAQVGAHGNCAAFRRLWRCRRQCPIAPPHIYPGTPSAGPCSSGQRPASGCTSFSAMRLATRASPLGWTSCWMARG